MSMLTRFIRRPDPTTLVLALIVLMAVGACVGAYNVWTIATIQSEQENQRNELLRLAEQDAADAQRGLEDQVEQTVLGCQRGNELRRALHQIASEQARRTTNVDGATRLALDPDAFRIESCQATAIRITGQDPGPISNFVN